jgi:hypothetical protein
LYPAAALQKIEEVARLGRVRPGAIEAAKAKVKETAEAAAAAKKKVDESAAAAVEELKAKLKQIEK